MTTNDLPFRSVEDLQERLRGQSYLADRSLATSIYLAVSLGKPLLLEGEAGVGKTEVAKSLATTLDRNLIRLQCYEGIDASQALYEWDYSRQLIAVRAMQADELADPTARVSDLFGEEFLVERPLLAAIRAGDQAVLLVDELDRADDEFEAFLLEVLSEFAVTIPELGRVAAAKPPAVVITSNRTRELHDALKRRCLYHWIDHPTLDRGRHHRRPRARGGPRPGPAGRRCRRAASRHGDREATRRGRGDRLGARARVPGRGRAERRGRLGHARRRAEGPRRPRAGPGRYRPGRRRRVLTRRHRVRVAIATQNRTTGAPGAHAAGRDRCAVGVQRQRHSPDHPDPDPVTHHRTA